MNIVFLCVCEFVCVLFGSGAVFVQMPVISSLNLESIH